MFISTLMATLRRKSEKGLRWWLYQGGEKVADTVVPLQRGLDGHVGSQLPLLLS